MPAKEQTEDKQSKDSLVHDESLSNASGNHGSQKGIIGKIYDVVLSRETVQKGVKKIKATYHDVIFEGKVQIDGIKRMSEEVYLSTRERVRTWCYSITIYNHLTSLWLIKNLPHNADKIVSYEEFLASFQNLSKDVSQESEDLARNFYKQARDVWINLKNSDLEDLKQACLLISAKAIAMDYKIEVEGFSSALLQLFNALDGNKKDIISNDAFYMLIRKKIGTDAAVNETEFRRATDAFYTFAKRFAFLEFPLTYANQDILKVLVKFAKEKLDILGEVFLTRVDNLLNLAINKLGYEYQDQEKGEPMTLLDRYNVILEKIMLVTNQTYKTSKLAIQSSGTYQYLDKHVHFENRYNDLVLVSQYVYEAAVFAVTPAYKAINFTYNKVLKEYVFAIAEISYGILKHNLAHLKEKYAVLKDATINLKNNILEIRINKETFDNLTAMAKTELALFYAEVKSLDYDKLKIYGSLAYNKAKERVKALTGCGSNTESKEEKQVDEAKKDQKEEKNT